jgi:type I restriction enzyme S subunit
MKQSRTVSEKPSIVWANNALLDEDRLDGKFYDVKFIEKQTRLLDSNLPTLKLKDLIINMNAPIGWQGIPSSAYREKGKGIPLIRIQNIKDNQLDLDSVIDVDPQIYYEQPAIQADKNDIIITRVGTIGRLCKIPINVDKVAMGQNLTRVSFDTDKIDVDFILAYMNTDYCLNQMIRFAYGGVQPSLTNKNIKDLLIILPKREIQKYIGNKVRKAEQCREEAEQLKKEAEQLLINYLELEHFKKKLKEIEEQHQKSYWVNPSHIENRLDSTFYSSKFVFADKILNNMSNKYMFKDIIEDISNGATPKGANYLTTGIPFLRVQNIVHEIVDLSDVVYINEETNNNLSRSKLEQGDLLISLSGSIGHTAIFPFKLACNINQHVARVKINKRLFNNYYVSLFLNSNLGKLQQHRAITGAIQGYLSYENIYSLRIPYINLEKQQEIGSKLQESQDRIFKLERILLEAKQDVESLIEGTFDESVIQKEN